MTESGQLTAKYLSIVFNLLSANCKSVYRGKGQNMLSIMGQVLIRPLALSKTKVVVTAGPWGTSAV